ncbi:hypothetical protein, unlikely [Trypanosoma brucei gambiense DAL972]|uniref:Uncharacterized protein n=1 Tax=Trypanosoma brucei gambiense (strain MHOM/CI/86/DAL972) TaxID=679716 RepID=C9ZPR1_TRYB9|nr:hypothetical protein, unlikely [Trypanosoma brucei gambiense DAL972]CBH11389.1 hypothetical protein, unlikely [Trypanosoma brucei gambiense DAL972]|eukprot:XP_011773676.1 hypothetical protein, unlikely [Trypanosoma brucei gambiense DAL972]
MVPQINSMGAGIEWSFSRYCLPHSPFCQLCLHKFILSRFHSCTFSVFWFHFSFLVMPFLHPFYFVWPLSFFPCPSPPPSPSFLFFSLYYGQVEVSERREGKGQGRDVSVTRVLNSKRKQRLKNKHTQTFVDNAIAGIFLLRNQTRERERK